MDLATVVTLILFGLVLIVVEVIFVPGTTLVGVAGFVFLALGVILGFKYFGSETGWTLLGSTTVVGGLILYYAFQTNVWGKFALKSAINSKVNEVETEKFKVGQEGVAISALRPMGKADLNNTSVEVKTLGEYVESGTRVRIIKVSSNQIVVESIN
jgi:membrane-bound ClpP family serine protease